MAKVPIYNFGDLPSGAGADPTINVATQSNSIEASIAQFRNNKPGETIRLGNEIQKTGALFANISQDIKNVRDTSYAKDLVNQYTKHADDLTTKYLQTNRKEALDNFGAVNENLVKLQKDMAEHADNDMVSRLFEENSNAIYNSHYRNMLKHSIVEGKKYSVDTQKDYTDTLLQQAKHNIATYKEEDGEFNKYLHGVFQSIDQLGELQGLNKSAVDLLKVKYKTEAYSSVLNTLLNNYELEEGKSLIEELKKDDYIDADKVISLERNYSSSLFKMHVDDLSETAFAVTSQNADVMGEYGAPERLNLSTGQRIIETSDYTKQEKKEALKRLTAQVSKINREVYKTGQGYYKEVFDLMRSQPGVNGMKSVPVEMWSKLTGEQQGKVLRGTPEYSDISILNYLLEKPEFLTVDKLQDFRHLVTDKDYNTLLKRGSKLKNENDKREARVQDELVKQAIVNKGLYKYYYKTGINESQKSLERLVAIKEKANTYLTSLARQKGRQLSREEKSEGINDLLKLEAIDSYLPFGIWKHQSPIYKHNKVDFEKLKIKYLGTTNAIFKHGDLIPINKIPSEVFPKYYGILKDENLVKPTYTNMLNRWAEDGFPLNEDAEKDRQKELERQRKEDEKADQIQKGRERTNILLNNNNNTRGR